MRMRLTYYTCFGSQADRAMKNDGVPLGYGRPASVSIGLSRPLVHETVILEKNLLSCLPLPDYNTCWAGGCTHRGGSALHVWEPQQTSSKCVVRSPGAKRLWATPPVPPIV
jgi:hypothetical protein